MKSGLSPLARRCKAHGITVAQFRLMWRAQDGKCRICTKPLSMAKPSGAQIEHDHKTKVFRGIAHWYCNMKIIAPIERAGRERALATIKYLGW